MWCAEAKNRDRRPHVPEERDAQRQDDAHHDAAIEMRRQKQGRHERHRRDDPIMPLRLPGLDDRLQIHQSHDGHHDHRREHGLGQVI